MGLEPKVKQGRNELCRCGSGLKAKHCHQDPGKQAACQRVVNEHMLKLIMKEKHKRGLLTDEQYQAFMDRYIKVEKPKTSEHEVGEILDKAGLKRCAGALCSAPIPDTEEYCITCKKKMFGGN